MSVLLLERKKGTCRVVSRETEADLVGRLLVRIRNDWPIREVGTEVRSHGRSRLDVGATIRMAAPDGMAEMLVIGIEAKLSDGLRAVSQAVLNRYAVDASFIAMPAGRISPAVAESAKQYGIGALEVMPYSLRIVVPARRSAPDASLRTRVRSQLTKVRGRGSLAGAMLAFAEEQS